MAADKQISFRLEDYDFDLPAQLIAQQPVPVREKSRLLVLDRSTGAVLHSRFDKIGQYLRRGDLLVVNDTRVVPARLAGYKKSGGRVELLVLDPYKPKETGDVEGYCCLVKGAKGIRAGHVIELSDGIYAEVINDPVDGMARVGFPKHSSLVDILDSIGRVPLPPYIERPGGQLSPDDCIKYQTEYACNPGAIAAPTAGLHFSRNLLDELGASGVNVASLTLHVGYGTFVPIRCGDIRDHRMHPECITIREETADAVNRAGKNGGRVIAVGTTVVRSLEWITQKFGKITSFSGMCDHYIYPGSRFDVVNCMVTNFHLPKSSLILLVSAFAGRSRILSAYREAVMERYRFFSYGDAMLII